MGYAGASLVDGSLDASPADQATKPQRTQKVQCADEGMATLSTCASVVGVFNTPDQAEQTVQQLIEAGVAPEHISVIAREFETKNQVTVFLTTGDVALGMAGTGAWVGGPFGLLAGGTAMLWAPVVGPLVVLGTLVATALDALQGVLSAA